jgi:hypothetical protein
MHPFWSVFNYSSALARGMALALTALALSLCPAKAGQTYTLWSNIGPEANSWDDAGGWGLYGQNVQDGPLAMAFAFTLSSAHGNSYQITQLKLPMGVIPEEGKGRLVTVVLADNNGHDDPGHSLYRHRLKVPYQRCCAKLFTIALDGDLILNASHQYWIEVLPSINTTAFWPVGYRGAQNLASYSITNGKTWGSSEPTNGAAFAIYGVPAH